MLARLFVPALPLSLLSLCLSLGCSSTQEATPNDAGSDNASPNDAGSTDSADSATDPGVTMVGSWLPDLPSDAAGTASLADMAFTNDGSVLIVGSVEGTTALGKGSVTSRDGKRDGFIAKLSYPGLEVQWVRTTDAIGDDAWRGVAMLASGDAIVAGYAEATEGLSSMRVTRISAATGDEVWSKLLTATGTATASMSAHSVVTTASGGIVVSGTIEGTTTLDSVTLTSKGYTDLFALALDDAGTAKWGFVDGVGSADYSAYVTIDRASGDLVLSGMQGSPDRMLYVARLNSADGTKRWSKSIGTPGQAAGFRAVSDGRSIYVVGKSQGIVEFDSDTSTAETTGRLVSSFGFEDGNVPWATVTTVTTAGTSESAYRDVTIQNGQVMACGSLECVWLDPSTGAIVKSWTPKDFSYDGTFVRVLVDTEGRVLVGGGAYGKLTLNGTEHQASSFAYRPYLLLLKP